MSHQGTKWGLNGPENGSWRGRNLFQKVGLYTGDSENAAIILARTKYFETAGQPCSSEEAANAQGLVLVGDGDFRPPPRVILVRPGRSRDYGSL